MDTISLNIADTIVKKNDLNNNNLGLLNGKAGICFFMYNMFDIYKDSRYKYFADKLYDELVRSVTLKDDPAFEKGLSGIGWCIEYFVQHNFLSGNQEILLENIDKVVFRSLNETKSKTVDLEGLTGYLLYIVCRLENFNGNPFVREINSELLIYTINKIDEVAPSMLQYINGDVFFDLFWKYPLLLFALKKAFDLNIYNDKIACMFKQWTFYFESQMPAIHINRLYLAIALKYLNQTMNVSSIEKQIKILLFSIDFDKFRKEIDTIALDIQHGWFSIVLLLDIASQLFSNEYPNYEQFKNIQIRLKKAFLEDLILITQHKIKDDDSFSISESWSGVGLLFLILNRNQKI